jgi:LacI family transcriptional regulator
MILTCKPFLDILLLSIRVERLEYDFFYTEDKNLGATLGDIADAVGIKKSTVSVVLNNKETLIKVSEPTRKRIFEVAKELGYHPNAWAKALRTRRTGHIGFILSDTIADGWENDYYAKILSGVESMCNYRGYGLNISRYNLSNIDSFVFPKRIGQRSVDGLVLAAGPIQEAVIRRFKEFDIPCVCVGDDVEVAGLIPTVSCEIVGALYQTVAYALSLGHTRIGYCFQPTQRGMEVAEHLVKFTQSKPFSEHCQIHFMKTSGEANYRAARPLVDQWLTMPEESRLTCLIGNDQLMMGVLKEISRHGLNCPQDLGLISTVDSSLSEYSNPGLSSLHLNLAELGKVAATLLLDHLDEGISLTPSMSRNDLSSSFVIRESCRSLKGKGQ